MTAATAAIHVANMMCEGCERGVRATLQVALPSVLVAVDLPARTITLDAAARDTALAALRVDGWEAQAA